MPADGMYAPPASQPPILSQRVVAAPQTSKNDVCATREIHSKEGATFRHNIICQVIFAPTYPAQPPNVIRVVGRTGERLGDWRTNPQIERSPRVETLVATTVVR
jgi:hypothetical protein